MTEPKLCKDCRWAQPPVADLIEPRPYDWVCSHATARREPQPDLVLGRPVALWQDNCVSVRRDPNRCGITGQYWEPREEPWR